MAKFSSLAALVAFLAYASVGVAALTFNATTVTSDGALTLTGSGASTWDIGTGALSIQTTNNGAVTFGGGTITAPTLVFTNATGTSATSTLGVNSAKVIGLTFTNATGTAATITTVVGTNVSSTGAFAISATGTPIIAHLSGTGSLGFGALSSSTTPCQQGPITVNGASEGDTVVASIGSASSSVNGFTWSAYVSSTNTVVVRGCNNLETSITVNTSTWRADVWKH